LFTTLIVSIAKDKAMTSETTYIQQLGDLIKSFPPDSILSRTIYQDDTVKILLFGFQPGQELSEHTAAVPALLHFLKGEAQLDLAGEVNNTQAGTWARIPPRVPHSIHAKTETLLLLYLLFPD
jgi:quercetin dioxygenase-like cupin family protein